MPSVTVAVTVTTDWGGGGVKVEVLDEVVDVALVVPLIWIALALNASKEFAAGSGGAFTENTIPLPQWPVCWHDTQIGLVSFTVNWKEGNELFSEATGTKPESNPPESGTHGSVNDTWVAVWFFGWNMRFTTSPTFAVIFEGVYVRVPFKPTATSIVAARAAGKADNIQVPRENIEKMKQRGVLKVFVRGIYASLAMVVTSRHQWRRMRAACLTFRSHSAYGPSARL